MQLIYNWITLSVWFYFHVQETSQGKTVWSDDSLLLWYFTNCRDHKQIFFFLLKHEHFALHTLCHTKQNTLLAVLEVRIMTWFCSAEKAKPDHLLIFVSPIETFRRQWQQHQSLEYKRHSSLFWAEWRFAPIRSICLLKQVQGHYKWLTAV